MKKILLTIALTVLGTAVANAQFGVTAGYSNVTETYSYNGGSKESENYNSAFIGIVYELDLSKVTNGLFFETGLYYYNGGKKYDTTPKETFKESSLAIPALVNYLIPVGNFALCPYAGVEFFYGLDCTSTYTATVATITATTTTDWYEDTYNKFDVCAEIGVGLMLSENLGLYVDYSKGLMNTSKIDDLVTGSSSVNVGVEFYF